MSIRDLITILGNNPLILITVFVALPLAAWLYGLPLSRSRAAGSPHCYVYATLVYLVSIPGSLALVLTGYALFFLRTDLLSVNLLVFFLPIVSLVVTLIAIRSKVDLDRLPGFGRIVGLFALLITTFVLVLFVQKTRIWVLFHGSLLTLLVFIIILFLVLRWAAGKVLAGRR